MSALLEARSLLLEGITESNGTGKEGARRLGISPAMLSMIGKGKKYLAVDLQPKVSAMSLKAALGVLIEATGLTKWFSFFTIDRHPQNLIRRARKEDGEADAAYENIADRLIDKPEDKDLTADDIPFLQQQACEIAHRIEADINCLVGLAERYPSLRLEKLFTDKEKICPKADW